MRGFVFSDREDILAQVLTFFRQKMEVDGAVYADNVGISSDFGAKKLYLLQGTGFSDNVSEALLEIFEKEKYDFIFITSTALGREVAGIISDRMGKEIIAEIFDFNLVDSRVRTKRFAWGGKTVTEEESDCTLFTVMPGVVEATKAQEKSEVVQVKMKDSRVSLVQSIPKTSSTVDLEHANVIVSIGRGIGKKESIDLIMPLVKAVKGELAGSRPVCLDYQWLSEDRQVGLSGRKVKPKLYIALGISGQIQHIAGMRGSKAVIAINRDKAAPIFEEADYGIVGDLFQIVPALVNALQR
ncbi:MAG: electron transfer flavoprotein subunit alpha/FixB family protein [Candidatus Thermoplasmatota archaeon]|jgi:electron transfer flavoprotein alpha subunit|nr:electron transfer flavoprotein subunit alpha/FixB family protein [Candidatus Thermoplasmatota archaeon]